MQDQKNLRSVVNKALDTMLTFYCEGIKRMVWECGDYVM